MIISLNISCLVAETTKEKESNTRARHGTLRQEQCEDHHTSKAKASSTRKGTSAVQCSGMMPLCPTELDRTRVRTYQGIAAHHWRGAMPCMSQLQNPTMLVRFHDCHHDLTREKFEHGTAEDQAKVISTDNTVTVAYGTFYNCVHTQEFSRLEPGVIDNKYYAKGIGEIKQVTKKGAQEFQELVNITH